MPNKKTKFNTRSLLFIALFVALISVCAWINIPLAIPCTLQTLAIFLACFYLKAKKAFAAVAIYLLLGFCGVPVFSGLSGGFGALFNVQGGYLLGFLAIPLMQLIFEKNSKMQIFALILGTFICYALGATWYFIILGSKNGFFGLLAVCVLPFVIPDAIKFFIAYFIYKRIKPR